MVHFTAEQHGKLVVIHYFIYIYIPKCMYRDYDLQKSVVCIDDSLGKHEFGLFIGALGIGVQVLQVRGF